MTEQRVQQRLGERLESLDLGKYAEAFVENEFGFDILSDLSEDDLREIGLPMGARKRLMRAICGLTGGHPGNFGLRL